MITILVVDKDTLPTDYVITEQNVGDDDSLDSDINETDGKSDTVTITDSNITNLDGGAVRTYCLGDYVWDDTNANGLQDDGESGIANVTVTLNETGATVDTDENGSYQFCGLKPGTYSVTVDKNDLPEGYVFTTQNVDGNTSEDKDSDVDSDGKSDSVTITDDNITTLDAGAYNNSLCLGDYIWKDDNMDGIQDENESGIADVNITLYDANGTELNSTTTDENGKYEFCDLSRGEYYIIVDKDTLPYGYVITTQNADGSDDNNDSDINATDGKSDTVTIGSESNLTLDGGAYPTYCLGDMVWDDKNANGIQDDGESGIADVNITLYDANGTELSSTTMMRMVAISSAVFQKEITILCQMEIPYQRAISLQKRCW